MKTLRHYFQMLQQIVRLPVARLHFQSHLEPDDVRAAYDEFTGPHPKYKIIRNKWLGVALVDLTELDTREKYLEAIKGKNNGAFHAKRARGRGYVVVQIDRNRYVEDIHAINTSIENRQGRPMDRHYQERCGAFPTLRNFRYYGVLDSEGKLVAYANLALYGNVAGLSQLLGYRNNDGIMHLLITDIVCQMIDQGHVRYVMYDTFFGAQPGLQLFKTILGFKPYRATYSMD